MRPSLRSGLIFAAVMVTKPQSVRFSSSTISLTSRLTSSETRSIRWLLMAIVAQGKGRAGDTACIIPRLSSAVGRLSYGLQTCRDFFDRVTLQDVAFQDSREI